jgi:hypothetical protein
MIRSGAPLPPIIVNGNIVHDGNNRVEASALEGLTEIEARDADS